jgi:hypothetical protein
MGSGTDPLKPKTNLERATFGHRMEQLSDSRYGTLCP